MTTDPEARVVTDRELLERLVDAQSDRGADRAWDVATKLATTIVPTVVLGLIAWLWDLEGASHDHDARLRVMESTRFSQQAAVELERRLSTSLIGALDRNTEALGQLVDRSSRLEARMAGMEASNLDVLRRLERLEAQGDK